MKSTRLTFSAATLAALTTVALFGCGGGGDSTTDPTPSPTPTVGPTPTPTPTPSPTPTPTPPPLTATGRVRFIEGTNTVEANPDGSNKVVVGPGRSRGALSPDGTRVVYLGSTYINGSPELYIENADGTNTRPLGVGTRGVKAVWSPDGTKIAYSDRGAPVTIGSVTGSSDELWSINPDGTGAKQLTVSLSAGYGGDFAWSPDGTKFVFATFIAGKQKAYIVNADGTGLRRLNDDDTFTPERDVRWTKANKIYYRDSGDYVKSIYRVNPDGTGTQRVFGLENSATVPLIGTYAVSPDETYVAFNGTLPGSGTAGDVTSVYIAQVGSAAYRLLATGGEINDWR